MSHKLKYNISKVETNSKNDKNKNEVKSNKLEGKMVKLVHLPLAQCHRRAFSNMRRRDFEMLMTNLEGNPSLIYIFHPLLWIRRTLDEVCLHQPNIARAESKLVQTHAQLACACSVIYDTTELPLH